MVLACYDVASMMDVALGDEPAGEGSAEDDGEGQEVHRSDHGDQTAVEETREREGVRERRFPFVVLTRIPPRQLSVSFKKATAT